MPVLMPLGLVLSAMFAAPQVPGLPAMAAPGGLGTLVPVGETPPMSVAVWPFPVASVMVPQLASSKA